MVLDALGWLVGDWVDDRRWGEPGEATAGGEAWRWQLGGRVLVRTGWCEYPPTGEQPGFHHDDLLVVFPDVDGHIGAMFWDNHGHVIRYTTATIVRAGLEFTFESDAALPGPRQLLRYQEDGSNRLGASFNIQPPGAGTFSRYLQWQSSRAKTRP